MATRRLAASRGPPQSAVVAANPSWRLALLWLAGADMRLTLLAVPPVLPLIHADLQLDEKGVAALAGLPVLLLGVAAVPGSLLIARIGPRHALIFGLCLIGMTSALRGIGPSVLMLFGMTFLMGCGVSISQPTLPTLVREWFPHGITRATGFWSNGLLVGELLSASLTLPLVLPIVGSWEASFVVWAAPVLVTAFLFQMAPAPSRIETGIGMPDWRNANMWHLGIFQSSASMVYFGANTFIPDYLHATNQADLVGLALASLNGFQIPASAVVGLVPLRILARRSTTYLVGAAIAASLVVSTTFPGAPLVIAAGVFGFCAAYVLVLSFALPALLAKPGEVARLAAGTFTVSYSTAFVVTLVSGAVWDATHVEASAFLPMLAATLVFVGLGPGLVSAALRSR